MADTWQADSSPLESVDRALLALQALAQAGARGMSLDELAATVGLNKATAHRALAAPRFRGFVVQTPSSGSYLLEPPATKLAEDFFGDENLPVGGLADRTMELLTIARHLGEPSAVLIGARFDAAKEVLAQLRRREDLPGGVRRCHRLPAAEFGLTVMIGVVFATAELCGAHHTFSAWGVGRPVGVSLVTIYVI